MNASEAQHAMHDAKAEVLEAMNERLGDVRERLSTVDVQLRTAARERPLLVVAGALTLGYIFARIISR